MKYSVLFVCTANICRSPMAAALWKARIGPNGDEWRVESAGVWAIPGYPSASRTLEVLRQKGIEASEHRSRLITKELVETFQLFLTMERGQREALRMAFPQAAGKVFLLSEIVGEETEIADPIGRSLDDFLLTAREIDEYFEHGADRLIELAREPEEAGSDA